MTIIDAKHIFTNKTRSSSGLPVDVFCLPKAMDVTTPFECANLCALANRWTPNALLIIQSTASDRGFATVIADTLAGHYNSTHALIVGDCDATGLLLALTTETVLLGPSASFRSISCPDANELDYLRMRCSRNNKSAPSNSLMGEQDEQTLSAEAVLRECPFAREAPANLIDLASSVLADPPAEASSRPLARFYFGYRDYLNIEPAA